MCAPLTRLAAPVLVLGAAHAGKSVLATQLLAPDRAALVLGTATLKNEAFARRLEQLQQLRPPAWETVEAGADLPAALDQAVRSCDQVLVDSVSQWLAGLLVAGSEDVDAAELERAAETKVGELLRLVQHARGQKGQRLVLVSSEVGGAPAPTRGIERLYRRLVGETHQKLAQVATSVVHVTAGIPLVLKSGGPA